MFIINVIPIARGIGKEMLSYFSATELQAGSVIKVPLRNRHIPALVLSSEPASDSKSELKNSSFAIRKAGSMKARPIFLPQFIEAAHDTAEYFAGSTGSVLTSITTKAILDVADKVKPIELVASKSLQAQLVDDSNILHEPYALQADEDERLAHYKSLIREQFARKRSVFFCLPTIQDTKRIFEALPKGIESYTYVFNSAVSKKDLLERWNDSLSEPHPILIIATGSFLGLPRSDIGTIVVERESSTGFKSQTRPYVDIRTFAEFYARKLGARLVFGDLLLRTETVWRTRNSEMAEFTPLKFRSTSPAETIVLDMKKYKTLDAPEFRILSDELEALVKENKERNQNLFIFAARRGLSPMTICGDCATPVLCTRCSAPIILHRGAENFFLCHRCGERRSAEERCRICGSWKLTTLGIGIELIEDALRNIFPDTKILRMDKDLIKTHKQALACAKEFYNSPGSVLLGTEMALAYLEKPVENSAVAAIDSLFSIPDFRINEKIMSVLLRMRSITQRIFIVQTRSRDQHVFDYAAKGNLMDFYREEIEERKKLDYPPFSTLLKITVRGTQGQTLADMKIVEDSLHEFEPLVFPAFIETLNKKTVMHALIKIPRDNWVHKKLLEKLLELPPQIAINVDPESLL